MAYTIEYWKRQKIINEQKKKAQIDKNNKILNEIIELERAYKKVGQYKSGSGTTASTVRKNAQLDKLAKDLKWRGKSKKNFDKKVKDDVKIAADRYYSSIDAVQDEIGRALDRKRQELSTGIFILDGINRALISINGTIRNWIN